MEAGLQPTAFLVHADISHYGSSMDVADLIRLLFTLNAEVKLQKVRFWV